MGYLFDLLTIRSSKGNSFFRLNNEIGPLLSQVVEVVIEDTSEKGRPVCRRFGETTDVL